jgi:hypothetical protein
MFKVTKGAPQVILSLAPNADQIHPQIEQADGVGDSHSVRRSNRWAI